MPNFVLQTDSMLLGFLFTSLFVVTAIILFVLGVTQQQNRFFNVALFFVLASMALGGYSIYKWRQLQSQLQDVLEEVVNETFMPREKEAVYEALFGGPNDCVDVLSSRDKVLPLTPKGLWIEAMICPAEVQRINQLHNYRSIKESTRYVVVPEGSSKPSWFQPYNMGDSLWIFTEELDSSGPGKTLYVSLDSNMLYAVESQRAVRLKDYQPSR